MKLNFKEFGTGKSMIILHGLLGSLDNWQTLARKFAEDYKVYTIDQRNHGQSDHSSDMSYDLMAEDLLEFIQDHDIQKPVLIGHSMGGKTVMHFALQHPDLIDGLIVADICPREYPVHHQEILDALNDVDFEALRSRKEVEEFLFARLGNMGVVYFLTKNIFWVEKDKLGFRFNLEAIRKNIEAISGWPASDAVYNGKTKFIRAGKANYIKESEPSIERYFPNSSIITVDSGHWIHAEKPEEFYKIVKSYLNE